MPRPLQIHLRFRVGAGTLRAGLAAALLSTLAGDLASENVTLTTYYPAPSGVYTQMITTSNTFLARDANTNSGQVTVGSSNSGTGQQLDVYSYMGAANNSAIRATYPNGGSLAGTEFAALANRGGSWSGVYANQGSAGYAAYFNGAARIDNGGVSGNYGLIPGYQNWAAYGTGAGGAAIYNDGSTYKTLMLVGNSSAGGSRQVSVWDQLNVNGNAVVAGVLYPGCYWKAFGNGGATYCNFASERAVAFDYNGGAYQPTVMNNTGTTSSIVSQWFYTTGNMLCCRIHE